ncbi:HCL522Cp [Eremothecium sinecaudum]|uniref:HCL522Cp n=1 Tax=Eremothecium sinecaudum TaxID=45286 RepID=A0A109UY43_9SACH|nr:HCL522Cp [Eremothecium sinecaudum]AMD19629.1 HCL522Cp [Eremothecium sinecaudum]
MVKTLGECYFPILMSQDVGISTAMNNTIVLEDLEEASDNSNSGDDCKADSSEVVLQPWIEEPVVPPYVVRNMAVLSRVFESISGKDKMAKIAKCMLDLLRQYVSRKRRWVVSVERDSLAQLSKLLESWNLRLILSRPGLLLRVFAARAARELETKSVGVCDTLSTFRQVMRCGNSPFLIVDFYRKIRKTWAEAKNTGNFLEVVNRLWMNQATLTDVLFLYYAITDEMSLLHKMGVWSHEPTKKFVDRHGVLSWEFDILLSLKNAWFSLQELNAEYSDLQIQLQVLQRSWALSQQLHSDKRGAKSATSTTVTTQLMRDLRVGPSQSEIVAARLAQLRKKRRIVYLDLGRLTFDLMANSTDVFEIQIPPGTYSALSLCSGVIGFAKLWLLAKADMIQAASEN